MPLQIIHEEKGGQSHGYFTFSAPPPFLHPFNTCLHLQAVTTFPREMLLPPSQICHALSATHPLSTNLDARVPEQPVKMPILAETFLSVPNWAPGLWLGSGEIPILAASATLRLMLSFVTL